VIEEGSCSLNSLHGTSISILYQIPLPSLQTSLPRIYLLCLPPSRFQAQHCRIDTHKHMKPSPASPHSRPNNPTPRLPLTTLTDSTSLIWRRDWGRKFVSETSDLTGHRPQNLTRAHTTDCQSRWPFVLFSSSRPFARWSVPLIYMGKGFAKKERTCDIVNSRRRELELNATPVHKAIGIGTGSSSFRFHENPRGRRVPSLGGVSSFENNLSSSSASGGLSVVLVTSAHKNHSTEPDGSAPATTRLARSSSASAL
jgi:hypothetical protein